MAEKTNKEYRIANKLFIPMITLFGVILGASITGYITIKSQRLAMEAMDKKTAVEYSIAKNQLLVKYVEDFINGTVGFLTLISAEEVNKDTLNAKYFQLTGVSFKILAISDFNIGKESTAFVSKLSALLNKQAINNLKTEDINNIINSLVKWTIAVKSEMKVTDYSINKEELEKDLYRFFISNILSDKTQENK